MSRADVLSDPERRQQWVADAAATEALWSSTPAWRPEVAREDLGGELVVWSDAGMFAVDPVASAVAVHFDGAATLTELASDLADAAEVPVDDARGLVATLAVELTALGAIDGVHLPEPPPAPPEEAAEPVVAVVETEVGETTRLDPETGAEIRVLTEIGPDGNLVTTEFLPDGRRRVSTTMTFESGRGAEGMAVAEALAGDRSVAELVPIDSCLGSKLRNSDDVPLLSFAGPDGRIRSVRCHSPEVAERLRALAGDALVTTGERGPIEAFVVTPLEADGPLRIFDGHGRRRGRPRTPDEAVAVVDQILGERILETTPSDSSSSIEAPLPLGLTLLAGPDGRAVLAPLDDLEGWGLASRLKRAGWTLTWGRAAVLADGRVVAPSALGEPAVVADAPEVLVREGADLPAAQRVQALLDTSAGDEPDRQVVLGRVVALAGRSRWESLSAPLGEQLGVDRPVEQ